MSAGNLGFCRLYLRKSIYCKYSYLCRIDTVRPVDPFEAKPYVVNDILYAKVILYMKVSISS